MGAINGFEGAEFPGAQATIETSVGADDCPRVPDFEDLVRELEEDGTFPTTIRFGRAYTENTKAGMTTFCIIP